MRKFMRNERRLQLSLVVAIAFLFAALVFRGVVLNQTDARLCGVLYSLVSRSGATVGTKGSPGYAYYRAHPKELAAARAQNHQFLRQLPCNGKG